MSMSIELVEGSEIRAGDQLSVDVNRDTLPPITVGLYRVFIAKGRRGLDALQVYQHLLFNYRLQHTDTVQATNGFIERGLRMGESKVKAAKSLLRSMGIIEKNKLYRDTSGRVIPGQSYVKLNLLPNPGKTIGPEIAPMEKSPEKAIGPENHRVGSGPQMLEEDKRETNTAPNTAPAVKKDGKPKSEDSQFVALFFDLHKKYRHVAPDWTGIEGKNLKRDLKRLGLADLSGLARTFFADPPPDVARFAGKAGWGYNVFRSQIDKLLADRKQTSEGIPERTCPECGKKQTHTGQECIFCHASLKGKPDALRHAS
jgi:hypothetical protein